MRCLMLGPRKTQNCPRAPEVLPLPASAVSATPVLVVSAAQPGNALPNRPMQCVISAATTVKKSPSPAAGEPSGASPLNSLVIGPMNSLLSNGVGSMNQPPPWLSVPEPMLMLPLLGLPPTVVPRLALAPLPPPPIETVRL